MIEDGDRVMVCLPDGKDSYTLLDVLLHLRRRAPVRFELVAVNLDQGQLGFPKDVLPRYLSDLGVPSDLLTEDICSVVKEKGARRQDHLQPVCAAACTGASCTPKPEKPGRPRWRWAATARTSGKPCS